MRRQSARRTHLPSVGRAPECQDVHEDQRKEDQPQREADAMTEALREIVQHDDEDHDVHEGDQEQQEPPTRTTHDPQKDVGAIDRD